MCRTTAFFLRDEQAPPPNFPGFAQSYRRLNVCGYQTLSEAKNTTAG
jgi:hypothetical protein